MRAGVPSQVSTHWGLEPETLLQATACLLTQIQAWARIGIEPVKSEPFLMSCHSAEECCSSGERKITSGFTFPRYSCTEDSQIKDSVFIGNRDIGD